MKRPQRLLKFGRLGTNVAGVSINFRVDSLNDLYHSHGSRANVDQNVYEQDGAFFTEFDSRSQEFSSSVFQRGVISTLELMKWHQTLPWRLMQHVESESPSAADVPEFTVEDLKTLCMSIVKKIGVPLWRIGRIQAPGEPLLRTTTGNGKDLIPLTDTEILFIHRTAYDFLVDTKEEKRYPRHRQVTI